MTLKKLFLAAMASVLVSTGMQAQVENLEIFRHVGGNLNVGTEGIGFDVATPVTDYLEVSAGMSFMPGFKVDGDVNVKPIRITDVTTIPMESVNIEGKFARTTANFKVSCYPFGTQNALFVAAGFSFGGKKIAKLKGHSEDVKNFMADPQYPADVKNQVYAEIDKYDARQRFPSLPRTGLRTHGAQGSCWFPCGTGLPVYGPHEGLSRRSGAQHR